MTRTAVSSRALPHVVAPAPAVGLVMVGVGGQGILLASEVVARAAMAAGHQVKTNEVHGMAQRGGSVMAQVRFGREVHSPLVAEGTANILLSFEKIEAIRAAHFLAPDGLAIVSDQEIVPVTATSGSAKYPSDAAARLGRVCRRLLLFDAVAKAASLGSARASNTVMVGALSAYLDLPAEAWQQALTAAIKPAHLEVNRRAFEAGRELALKARA
jgi:indolepyruvate ferredoxin oxidoreductase beta subunit